MVLLPPTLYKKTLIVITATLIINNTPTCRARAQNTYPPQTPVTIKEPSSSYSKNPLILHVHNKEETIHRLADCKHNPPLDQCKCCLLQVHSSSDSAQPLDAVVSSCMNDHHLCTEQSLATLQKDTNSLDDLFKSLYDDAIVRPIYVDPSLIDSKGHFNTTTLPEFFAQAYAEKKLFAHDLSNPACIKVKDIAGSESGSKTVQLFLVTSTCSAGPATMYIIKEASNGLTEARNLKKIEKLEYIEQCIAPNVTPGLPTIALPIAYFSYPATGKVHYLATMPGAKGKTMASMIDEYQYNKTPQGKHQLERAFYILGKETGNFHKLHMEKVSGKLLGKTVIHSDLQLLNVFFDPMAGHTTWIDNETMAHSIDKKMSPVWDFDKALLRRSFPKMSLYEWYDISLKQFVLGYAETYPKNQQAQVIKEIKDMLYPHKTKKQGVYYDLKEIKDKYINPILDKLIALKR